MRVAIWINTWGVALWSLGEGKNLLEKLQYFWEVSSLQRGRNGPIVYFESDTELCSIALDSSESSLGLPLIILEKDGSFVCSVSTELLGRISTLVLLLLEEDTLGAMSAKVCDGSVTLVDREDRLLSSPWDKKSGVCGGGEVTE